MKLIYSVAMAMIASLMSFGAAMSADLDEITVAYFLEWPTPNQYAQNKGVYEKELGLDINWVSFDTGTAMSAAMASGDVHIAFSQGIPPFVVATSAGQDLQIVDVAVSYSDNDNCVVRSELEIDKTNAKELEGKTVGVPIGTAAHFGFLKQMDHFGVDISTMKINDMAPPDGAAAFANGNLDMVCGWGGALRRMVEYGNILLTGAEKEGLGIRVFDATTVPTAFGEQYPDIVSKFVKVTADMNARYAKDPEAMIDAIAAEAGMSADDARGQLKGFKFPDLDAQICAEWFGGGVQTFLKEVGDFFVAQGTIPSARDSYDSAADISFLQAAKGM